MRYFCFVTLQVCQQWQLWCW